MANLLVDIDDTLADTQPVMLAWVNRRLAQPLTAAALTREHRESQAGEYQLLVEEFLSRPSEHRIAPLAGALAGVRRLHAAGHRIHIVSSRKEPWHRPTLDWLGEHGFAEYVTEIHPRTSSTKGTEFKRQVAERIKPAAAFDDTHNVALALAPACGVVYLIDRPWNAGDDLPANTVRVRDFDTAAERFLTG